jgi:hypothetical protein
MNVSHFFDFFKISYPRFWTRMNMTTHKTRAHGQAMRSPALTGKV